MAETNEPTTTSAATKPTKATAPTASEKPSPILKQGIAPPNAPQARKVDPSLEGTYKVVHGSIFFGHGLTAYKGAIVQLSAEDADTMLENGIVEMHRGAVA